MRLLEQRVEERTRELAVSECSSPSRAKDGSRRPTHRRHRPRFQQPSRRHLRQPRADADALAAGPASATPSATSRPHRALPPRGGPDPTSARLLSTADRSTREPTDVNRLVAGMEDLVRRTVGPPFDRRGGRALVGLWPALVRPIPARKRSAQSAINARDAMPDGGRITIETANKWLDDRGATAERAARPVRFALPSPTPARACRRSCRSRVRPLLHHQAARRGHRPRPLHGPRFVRQSGGQVRIYSEVGEGTTVSCSICRAHRGGRRGPCRTGRYFRAAGAGETVLVVDDEPTVRMLMSDVLDEPATRVIEADDGAAGLRSSNRTRGSTCW